MNNVATLEKQGFHNESLQEFFSSKQATEALRANTHSFLAKIPNEALGALIEKSRITKYPKQAIIVSEGGEGSTLFIILSGRVRVFSCDDKSKEITLLVQSKGSCFGEISLLTEETRSASVVAIENTVCAVITKSHFNAWLLAYPDVAIPLLSLLSDKIRQLTDKLREMALSNVYERTAKTLQDLSVEERGIRVIYNKPTQLELAYMVGASREMVGRVLQELTKGGYIAIEHKKIILIKKLPASW